MKSNPTLHNLTKLILAFAYFANPFGMYKDENGPVQYQSRCWEIPWSFDGAALMRTKLYAWLEVLYLRRKVVVQQHGAAAHMIKIYGGFWYHSALNSLMLGVFFHTISQNQPFVPCPIWYFHSPLKHSHAACNFGNDISQRCGGFTLGSHLDILSLKLNL